MIKFIFYISLYLTIFPAKEIIGQENKVNISLKLIGVYQGIFCFRNDCITETLRLKRNNKFISISHTNFEGRKSKSRLAGTWHIEENILSLTTINSLGNKETNNLIWKDNALWFYSRENMNNQRIAMKKKTK